MKQTGIEKVSIRLKSEIDGNTTEYRYSGEYQWKDGGHCIAYIDYMGNALTKVGVEANEKMMLVFIEKTGHTYQRKHQEVADVILQQLVEWRCE